ncbi:MAG: hypothetical protein EP324_03330 [Gammaproteobacteria bacterium]|nr:MAG: hypothetical protein EP324_03330 [Gammaproteobacteria bacterium]
MSKSSPLFLLSLCLPLLALLPSVRVYLEVNMLRHMLVVMPLLVFAGFLFAYGVPRKVRRALRPWNKFGVPGLLLASGLIATWMIPFALDRAIENPQVDAAKTFSLFLAGIALALSLSLAPLVTQLFFIWNWVAMAVFTGVLYQSLPQRLCSAYLLDDQGRTGLGLVVFAAAIGCTWCASAWTRHHKVVATSTGG